MNAVLKVRATELAATSAAVSLTIFSNPNGKPVGKQYQLVNGEPSKLKTALPFAEHGEVRTFNAARELATFIGNLDASAHLCAGIPLNGRTEFAVTTKDKPRPNAISRSLECFAFPEGPGIGLLDHDWRPETPTRLHMTPQEFKQCLSDVFAWPIDKLARVSYPSSSSYIESNDGTANTGLRGHHMLMMLADASDWPRALECIHQRFIIAGFGWVLITENGAQHVRSIVDASVGHGANRAIYSGKAALGKGLCYSSERKFWFCEGALFDTAVHVPPLSLEELVEYDQVVTTMLEETAEQAAESGEQYRLARVSQMVENGTPEEAALAAVKSSGAGQLEAPWPITLADGEVVTVGDILADPKAYAGKDCLDPIEPDYQGGRPVAKIYTDRSDCFINSFAHGGNGRGGPKVYVLKPSLIDVFERYDHEQSDPAPVTRESPIEALKPAAMRFSLLSGADLANAPPMRWAVRGILPAEGLAALYGPSGSGKSFLILDLAAAVASGGEKWFGHRVTQCPVTYCALEGEAGIGKRVAAWSKEHSKPIPTSLKFVAQPFDLVRGGDVVALANAIKADGGAGGIVILDTLNRAAPGADENSSAEMGNVIAAAKRLQMLLGGIVLLVSHTGKDVSKGLRGHSSLFAALDAAIQVSKTGPNCYWSVAKSKDDISGKSFPFRLKVVQLGLDDEGETISSCVALRDSEATDRVKVRFPQSGHKKTAFDALRMHFTTTSEFDKAGVPAGYPCLLIADAIALICAKMLCEEKRKKERAQEAIRGLISDGLYGLEGAWLWRAYPTV